MHYIPCILALLSTYSLLAFAAVVQRPKLIKVAQAIENQGLQGTAGFYFCTNANFEGLCYRDITVAGKCITVQDDLVNIPHTFGDSVSSVSFHWGYHCNLYRDAHCEGPAITLHYPGLHDLDLADFNDRMSAYKCEYGH